MGNQKYAAFAGARPYFQLVRRALGDLVDREAGCFEPPASCATRWSASASESHTTLMPLSFMRTRQFRGCLSRARLVFTRGLLLTL